MKLVSGLLWFTRVCSFVARSKVHSSTNQDCLQQCKTLANVIPCIPVPAGSPHYEQESRTNYSQLFCIIYIYIYIYVFFHLKKIKCFKVRDVPMPYQNIKYPYGPTPLCSLIWTSLSAEKMSRNVRDVHMPLAYREYPYGPAHLCSLIWTSLSAEKMGSSL